MTRFTTKRYLPKSYLLIIGHPMIHVKVEKKANIRNPYNQVKFFAVYCANVGFSGWS